jgi:phosphoesterase RecJ-like protein
LSGTRQIVRQFDEDARFDATLIVDTAARSLLPRNLPSRVVTGPRVIIDHHVAHDDFGDVVVRDEHACATATVVIDLARALGVDPLPVAAAEPLYTALAADTGNFRYPGTSASTLRLAATLLEAGVDPWRVASQVFENWPMARMRLLGLMIDTLEFASDGKLAILCAPQDMIEKAGASDRMVEGLVEYGRMVKGVEISIMLWEQKPTADESDFGQATSRLSLRSAGSVDVSKIAASLGGGGHRAAAGATLHCKLDQARERVLAEAMRALQVARQPGS